MVSAKNFAMTAASTDLGLGDNLKNQLDAEEMDRKKKLLAQAQRVNQGGMGQAAQALFPGIGGMAI